VAAAAATAALALIIVSALAPILNAPKPADTASPNPAQTPPLLGSSSQAPPQQTPASPAPSPQSPSSPAPAPQGPAARERAMREAIDPRGRFSIDLPEDWAVRWVGDGSVRLTGGDVRDALVGIGPAGADGRRVTVIVDVTVLPAAMSPTAAAKYAETGLRRLTAYQSIQSGPSTVGGTPSYFRLFTHLEHGARLFDVQMYVTQGRQFYVLDGTTRSGRTDIPRDLPLILRIAGTFRLLPQR
jgi:hypothetical protein